MTAPFADSAASSSTGGGVRVRRAAAADAEAIAALSRESFVQTFVTEFGIRYPDSDLLPFLEAKHGAAFFRRWIEDPAQAVWVAEGAGAPAGGGAALAGYAACGPNTMAEVGAGAGGGELHRLYVDRAHHGRGVAQALMRELLGWLDGWTGRSVLSVWSGNTRAQRFYARYGYEKIGEYDYPVGASVDREFIMARMREAAA